MTADQLIQQYDAGAITARELVEGVWEKVYGPTRSTGGDISVGGQPSGMVLDISRFGKTVEATWTAAANYTIERIEEIRLFKEEIEWVQGCIDMSGITEPEKGIPEQRRILAREQSALAELSKGIRPEVLK
jgi:hypothetical protein